MRQKFQFIVALQPMSKLFGLRERDICGIVLQCNFYRPNQVIDTGVRCVLTSVSTSAAVGECRRAERRPKFKGNANEKARDDKATLSLHMEEQCHT